MANVGQTTVSFGALPGSDTASAVVTGQPAILATSFVEAWLDPTHGGTVDHSVDEHIMASASIGVVCSNIVPGASFTINLTTQDGPMTGAFSVSWCWY